MTFLVFCNVFASVTHHINEQSISIWSKTLLYDFNSSSEEFKYMFTTAVWKPQLCSDHITYSDHGLSQHVPELHFSISWFVQGFQRCQICLTCFLYKIFHKTQWAFKILCSGNIKSFKRTLFHKYCPITSHQFNWK